ncbi:MAG TPA: tetratricopeptide repeat protein [Bacteroidales bacterium]|nr:tetratricopeptide repeat protein [Bacteroidales bacterium]
MSLNDHNRDLDAWRRLALISALLIVLSFPLYLALNTGAGQAGGYSLPEFTGGDACIDCHRAQYELWKGSDHDMAMAHANDSSVRGDFNNTTFLYQGNEHRFYKKDSSFYVWTSGPDGKMGEFRIDYTFGFRPLQQYLVAFPGGRLQCLPLAWDTEKKQWYHLADTVYSDEVIDHSNWLYWTNQAQNWNGMCADCHSTNLVKGYNLVADSFNTTWTDINVHCEACHGAGSEHLKWAKLPEMARLADKSYGLLIQTADLDNRSYVERCARCHARRGVFGDFPGYTADLQDYLTPTLLVEPYYYPDGQILEEDYVYASFIHSKMYMTDIKCNDCHDVHSLKLIREAVSANDLCLTCHREDVYDTYDHHFHKSAGQDGEPLIAGGKKYEIGSGALCINCHMTGRYYMGVDFRRDHSFRIPRPDLSMSIGSPNACNGCHSDNTSSWADEYIRKWYGMSRRPHFGDVFAIARRRDTLAIEGLVKLALDELSPLIVRATAIYELEKFYSERGRQAVIKALSDPESLIRHQAVQSYIPANRQEMAKLLAPLLNDPVKAVRIQAAFRLSSLPVATMDSSLLREFNESVIEYIAAMEYTGEFSASRHNLGVIYQNLGQLEQAEKNYLAAIKIDDQFLPSMANLSVTYSRNGKNAEAEKLLRYMISNFPDYHDSHYSLGLLLAEMGQYDASLEELVRSSELMPENPRIWYNLAMMYGYFKDDSRFEASMARALALDPGNLDFLYALADHHYKQGNMQKVRQAAQMMISYHPDNPLGQQLLDALESRGQ